MRNPKPLVMVVAGLSSTFAWAATPTTQPANPDQAFMVTAAKDGLAEVAMARLALNQAQGDDVRKFAQQMIVDHGKANDTLLTLALQEKVEPPKMMDQDAQAAYDRLAALHGPAFDHAYLATMVSDHQHDVDELKREQGVVTDPALKDWVNGTLPVLQHHLEMATMLSGNAGR